MSDYLHQPVLVASTEPGRWNVICDACSHAAEDYVYPCADPIASGAGPRWWPPAVVYEHSAPAELTEWACPDCGATTRARMADAPAPAPGGDDT